MEDSLRALAAAGIECPGIQSDSRKLVHDFPEQEVRIIICRPTDIPTYVEYGAADLGLVGKDTLMEQEKDVVELLDVRFGYCRFVVAMPQEKLPPRLADGSYDLSGLNHQRVATKFPNVAEKFFTQRGMQVVTIKLHGNIELAPRVGLADMIVDIVSTGKTLRENRLVEVAPIAEATARLVANRVAYRMKSGRIEELTNRLRSYAATVGNACGSGGNA